MQHTKSVRRTVILIGAGGLLAAGALAGATASRADAETLEEVAYIMALDAEGITYSTEDAALNVGYTTCTSLDAGATVPMVIRAGVKGSGGYYSADDVAYITGAAIAAFCPDNMPAGMRT